MQTIQRTDTWLVYDGDPESLPWKEDDYICVERKLKDGSFVWSGSLDYFQAGKRHYATCNLETIQKGDLIRAL